MVGRSDKTKTTVNVITDVVVLPPAMKKEDDCIEIVWFGCRIVMLMKVWMNGLVWTCTIIIDRHFMSSWISWVGVA